MTPLVSIITPSYNVEKFLPETIRGILSQTFCDWEMIIVDDCSSDATVEVAQNFALQDKRIRVVQLATNSGPAISRNKAIELSKGRYIAFCDSDDIWLPEKLSKQIKFMLEKDAAISFTSYIKMEENGAVTKRIVKARQKVTYKNLLRSNYIGCSTAIYDANITGKVFMPNILKRQDYGLWLLITQMGHEAHGLQEPLVHYRMRSNSVSSNKIKAAQYHWKVLREVANIPLPKALWLFLHYAYIGYRKTNL